MRVHTVFRLFLYRSDARLIYKKSLIHVSNIITKIFQLCKGPGLQREGLTKQSTFVIVQKHFDSIGRPRWGDMQIQAFLQV